MLNGLKYVYMNQNRFSERIGASWRPETSFGGLGGQKRVTVSYIHGQTDGRFIGQVNFQRSWLEPWVPKCKKARGDPNPAPRGWAG